MPSPKPLEYGKYYHIYNRGINRENIFIEERNYAYFLTLYAKYIYPIADTFAYALLKNHFHVLLRLKTKEEIALTSLKTPSQYFSNLFNAYAKTINRTYDRTGSLFQRPFKRIEVVTDNHFARLLVYIHRNPQKHGFVDDFRDWPFTSYHNLRSQKPTTLLRDESVGWFDNLVDFEDKHNVDDEIYEIALE